MTPTPSKSSLRYGLTVLVLLSQLTAPFLAVAEENNTPPSSPEVVAAPPPEAPPPETTAASETDSPSETETSSSIPFPANTASSSLDTKSPPEADTFPSNTETTIPISETTSPSEENNSSTVSDDNTSSTPPLFGETTPSSTPSESSTTLENTSTSTDPVSPTSTVSESLSSTSNTPSEETTTSTTTTTSSETETASTSLDVASETTSSPILGSSGETIATTSSTNTVTLATTEEEATTTVTISETPGTTPTSTPDAEHVSTTIVTGDSYAVANILNLVNTNFLNSQGSINFSNLLDTTTSTIDMRTSAISSTTSPCNSSSVCIGSGDISLNLSNLATIQNQITLQAASGGNLLDQADEAVIRTGDAFAALNLVNLANTNFTNAHYFVLILNAFEDVLGDIVLPSLTSFLRNTGESETALSLVNDATIDNSIANTANSGSNQASSPSSTITTGSSLSYTNIVNQVNTTLAYDNLALFFRIGGNWQGEIFGGPTGITSIRTDDGLLFSLNGTFPLSPTTSTGSGTTITENATNTALINNRLAIDASSGENQVEEADEATITTGNARSVANVLNVANSNIIGKNWMLAVVNIFGDFKGNIAFGRPDLWVGGQVVDAPASIRNETVLTYKITVKNNGDSDATETSLIVTPDLAHLRILDASTPYTTTSEGALAWNLGTLSPGASQDITYQAQVENAEAGTRIATLSQVAERETDNQLSDNTDSLSVHTLIPPPAPILVGGGIPVNVFSALSNLMSSARPSSAPSPAPVLRITRTPAAVTLATSPRSARESLSIKNTASVTAHGVVIHDIIRNPEGVIISDEPWDVGTINPQEEIELGYDANFDDTAPAGTYTLTTTVQGENIPAQSFEENGTIVLYDVPRLQPVAVPVLTTSTILIGPTPPKPPIKVLHKQQTNTLANMTELFHTKTVAAADQETTEEPSYGDFLLPLVPLLILGGTLLARALRRKLLS